MTKDPEHTIKMSKIGYTLMLSFNALPRTAAHPYQRPDTPRRLGFIA
jgi:hypothetical protein